jgi:hypothetical protein
MFPQQVADLSKCGAKYTGYDNAVISILVSFEISLTKHSVCEENGYELECQIWIYGHKG